VTVQKDIMKMLLIIVTNVMLNVLPVLEVLEIVTHVLVTEKINHLVLVQMELMIIMLLPVHHVV
jgi:hypothetical protein